MKELEEISLKISEEEYRERPELNYSSISKFAREGFNCLETLKDSIESPSLTFGSAVDCLLTKGTDAFNNEFFVSDYVGSESINKVVKALWEIFGTTYSHIEEIPTDLVLAKAEELKLDSRIKDPTKRLAKVYEGSEYYTLLCNSRHKTLISSETLTKVYAVVETLRTSNSTKHFFEANDIFNPDIKRYYQLKFTANLHGIDYKIMADLIIVDYKNKVVIPVDLKTSSNKEWDFADSFIHWGYSHQARLYWRVIRDNMDRDEFFKDFELRNYLFIVVNKESLTPLVWEFKDSATIGKLTFGKNGQISIEDPEIIGRELNTYLTSENKVPLDINIDTKNDLTEFLNKL